MLVMQAAKEILSGVFQLSVSKTSVFLLVEDQVTVIDAGWARSAPSILRFLGRLGRPPEDISHIVATHYHADHIGGMAHLREKSAGRVAVHSSEVPFVQGESRNSHRPAPHLLPAHQPIRRYEAVGGGGPGAADSIPRTNMNRSVEEGQ